jgi:transmembrane sensor
MSPTRKQRSIAIREAAEWNLLLEEADLDAVQRRQYRAWLQSPLNAAEMARIRLIDEVLHRLPLKDPSTRKADNIINFQSYAPSARPRPSQPASAPPVRRFSGAKIAAAIAAGFVVATVAASMMGGLRFPDRVIITKRGDWAKQLLDDGTVVYAGPGTELRVQFSDTVRSVAVLRGEAFFDVAKEPGRPFVVATAAGSVRAVGTEFSTAYRNDAVVVTVAEGKVAVSPEASGHPVQPTMTLVANQQVVLSRSGAGQPSAVDADREVKWIRDWYDFDGERICEIVDELNRRHDVTVTVADPQVCRMRMNSLAFKPSELDDFVARINRWYADFPQRVPKNQGVVLRLERHEQLFP